MHGGAAHSWRRQPITNSIIIIRLPLWRTKPWIKIAKKQLTLMVMEASQNDEQKLEDRRRRRPNDGSETESETGQRPTKKRKSSPSGADTGSSLQERWDEMFERLRAFKEETGTCNVPNRYG